MLGGPARGLHGGLDAAGRTDSAGGVRQPGKSVRRAGVGSRARKSRCGWRWDRERGLILAANADRSGAGFSCWRRDGAGWGVAILRFLSAWQPIPDIPINVPVNPDVRTYVVALLLALASGLLFGMVPVRQVMRADPWQMIRTGVSACHGAAAVHAA